MGDDKLTGREKDFLLNRARASIARKLDLDKPGSPGEDEIKGIGPHITEKRGCFVTLHKRSRLRGCIGIFEGRGPLWKSVEEMAAQAAFSDPRFPQMSRDEFKDIDIEISVLSPLRKIDSVDEIKVGEHGIYITRDLYRGVLLPQVATEQNWDRDTFLDHTCMKAGLKTGCWRKPDTVIEIFSADIFGEKEKLNPDGSSQV